MNVRRSIELAMVSLLVLSHLACGASGMGADEAGSGDEWQKPGATSGADTSSAWDGGYIPPEEELEFDTMSPAASEHYVYIPAEERDAVIRVDAESLEIRMITVGARPTRVAALPAGDVAVVINSGTDDLSVITSTPEDDQVVTLESVPGVNAIAVSPSGDAAVVYYWDEAATPEEPVGDLHTVDVILFAENGKVSRKRVSIGFHPTRVFFHEDGKTAYIVTDDGISLVPLVGLSDGAIAHTVSVSNDALEQPEDREVFVTGDGDYAVVRDITDANLRVIDLAEETMETVALPGLPTDLDMVPGRPSCLVMMREAEQAALVDLARVGGDRADAVTLIDLTGSYAGAAAVSPGGDRAVLYSVTGTVKSVAVLDLSPEGPNAWSLYPVQKTVLGVALSEGGAEALLLHEAETGTGEGLEQVVAQSEGYTLFNLDTGYRKLVTTEYRWSQFLFTASDDARRAFILLPDTGMGVDHGVDMVDLDTFLVEPVKLYSEPSSLLYVPSSRKVAIHQQHPNGRITFIDVDTGSSSTKTGFELNALIH